MKILVLETHESTVPLPEAEWEKAGTRALTFQLKEGDELQSPKDIPDVVAARALELGLAKKV